ncbi:AraC family transcriptional regulator [Glaciimonas immobilis]|uniref:AraC-like DNA-binding protein n=1 Tax=Glaciimonas immobilis TaxID=728004 RepID=A0A840RPF5_9BURK|nr:AraC family transcriptional regulator [Glaciimonas immobilis]KAF3996836.1 AraC family transcriptional regulator [Glaciimonas immobilis]MBB5199613.1 AraC-like DNA-binding protein [Glaciimonas immobilis]
MDRLSPLFARFAPSARVFHSGSLCGSADADLSDGGGHIHLINSGRVTVSRPQFDSITIEQPSVLFFPRPSVHRLQVDEHDKTEMVCATIKFGNGVESPVMRALPEVMVVPLESAPSLKPMLALLFAEAFSDKCGRQAAIDRLTEYLMVLLLRHAMTNDIVGGGILAGLGDPRLSKAITAMHERPEQSWSLEQLAESAGMSRARFAVHFRETVGMTPLDYLTDWRVGVAQVLLKGGQSLKFVAPAVGYMSPTAFTRVFSQRIGASPTEWLAQSANAY